MSALRSKYPEPIDLASARARCLEGKGWAVTVTNEGAITADLTPGTEQEYDADDDACLRGLGADPDAPTPEHLVKEAYRQSTSGANCLRHAGWHISPAPSFETFRDSYETHVWYPWSEVPIADTEQALKRCPAPEPTY